MGRPMLLRVHDPGHVLCADLATLPRRKSMGIEMSPLARNAVIKDFEERQCHFEIELQRLECASLSHLVHRLGRGSHKIL